MCSILSVIRLIVLLYLLNCDSCHALDEDLVIKDASKTTADFEDKVFDDSDNYNFYHEFTNGVNVSKVCLLDNLKRNLLWWCHINGSLVTNGEELSMTGLCY